MVDFMKYLKFASVLAVLLFFCALFASNMTFNFVREYNGSGGRGGVNFSFSDPNSMAIGDDGLIYVSDSDMGGVYALNASDSVVKSIGGNAVSTALDNPRGIFVLRDVPFIGDNVDKSVVYYAPGFVTKDAGFPRNILGEPSALWIENNSMMVLDRQEGKVYEYDNTTRNLASYFGNGIGSGRLSMPSDMFIFGGRLYIADTGNNRVEVFERNYTYIESIGSCVITIICGIIFGIFSESAFPSEETACESRLCVGSSRISQPSWGVNKIESDARRQSPRHALSPPDACASSSFHSP